MIHGTIFESLFEIIKNNKKKIDEKNLFPFLLFLIGTFNE